MAIVDAAAQATAKHPLFCTFGTKSNLYTLYRKQTNFGIWDTLDSLKLGSAAEIRFFPVKWKQRGCVQTKMFRNILFLIVFRINRGVYWCVSYK